MSKLSDDFYFHAKLLGQSVGQKIEILHKTSCMHPDDRELYTFLEWCKQFLKSEKSKAKLGEIQGLVEKLGFAHWQRDVVTDLALRDSIEERTEHVSKKSASDGLPTSGS